MKMQITENHKLVNWSELLTEHCVCKHMIEKFEHPNVDHYPLTKANILLHLFSLAESKCKGNVGDYSNKVESRR